MLVCDVKTLNSDFIPEQKLKKYHSRMSGGGNECRIYVGNLPPDIRSKDIDDLFHKYGKIVFIDLKNRRGPPFAFVEFEDSRYALSSLKCFLT